MKQPLPPFQHNPFTGSTDPTKDDPLTMLLPKKCVEILTRESVALTSETRGWLYGNLPIGAYACRVVTSPWLNLEHAQKFMNEEGDVRFYHPHAGMFGKTVVMTMGKPSILPYITFENDIDMLHFKMRWG